MTIHVTIGEARERLTELVEAARNGEEVVLGDTATQGVRLVRDDGQGSFTPEQIVRRRLNTLGIWKDRNGTGPDFISPSMTDQEIEERWNRKFGPAA